MTEIDDSARSTSFPSRFPACLFRPVDIASLAIFRVAFGLIMVWEVGRYFANGWIERFYIVPTYHFGYWGFEWIKPWPGNGMYYHFVLLGILAAMISVGWCYRVSSIAFFFAFTYVFLIDQVRYLNHFYLVILVSFLMIFMPAHGAFAVDARFIGRIRRDWVPVWTVWILRTQMAIVYAYAALAKFNGDWLRGFPIREWLVARQDSLIGGPWCSYPTTALLFSYTGLLFDLLIVPLLLIRRTRPFAFAAVIVFHLTNVWLLDIGIFPFFSITLTTLFFSPDWPRRVFTKRAPPNDGEPLSVDDRISPVSCATGRQKIVVIGWSLFFAIQLVIPLRHYVYPGDVDWTEEGYRYSWRMRLHTKTNEARFLATDVDQGKTWDIQPLDYVTPDQLERMLFWNDMLVPFCQHVAESLKGNEGRTNVEVRGRVACSLHGRRPELLIEPELDLAAQRPSLRPAPWYRERTYPLSDRRNPGDFLAILYPESVHQNPWRGFSRGSYVLWRETISATNRTPQQTVQKIEIQDADQQRPTLRLIHAVDGTLDGTGLLIRANLGSTPEQLLMKAQAAVESEIIEIDSHSIETKVTQYIDQPKMTPGYQQARVWRAHEMRVPYRNLRAGALELALQEDVMRLSYSWGVAGQLNEIDYQIVSFSEPVKVSGTVVDCIVEQWDFTYVFPDRRLVGTVRRCLSEKVPGKVVDVEMNIRRAGNHANGDLRQHTTILRELIEFNTTGN